MARAFRGRQTDRLRPSRQDGKTFQNRGSAQIRAILTGCGDASFRGAAATILFPERRLGARGRARRRFRGGTRSSSIRWAELHGDASRG